MEPTGYTYSTASNAGNGDDDKRLKKIRLGVFVLVGMLVLWVFFNVVSTSLRFRLVSTDPATNKITILTRTIGLNFSKPIKAGTISITSSPSIITSLSASGKTVILQVSSLDASKNYTITLKSITDTSGRHVANEIIKFQPQTISWSSLSTSQQQALLKGQTNKSPSQTTNFVGFDALVSQGLSAPQEYELQQAILKFKENLDTVTIAQSSIITTPPDPNSTSMTTVMKFSITIAKTNYSATLAYTGLTQIELRLFDGTGQQVFDSGTLTATP